MTFVTEYGDVSVTLLLVIGTSQIRISLGSSAVLSVVVVSASFSRKIPSLPDSSHVIISISHSTTRSYAVTITDSITKQSKNHDTGVFLSGRSPSFLCRSAQKPDFRCRTKIANRVTGAALALLVFIMRACVNC